MSEVHLAAITSREENDAIVKYLQSQFSSNYVLGSSKTQRNLNEELNKIIIRIKLNHWMCKDL